MSGLARLRPALAYQIVHTLGWSGLRPVQDRTIEAVLAGHNCVVLAPTAGGKTEAAFFPVLSLMDEGDWGPVSVLYLSPIRALLNNQEDRVERLTGLIGRRSAKWHGDVNASARTRFIRDPTDVLLTTPESLEAMLMSPHVPARELFRNLAAVIIDEVHAFAGDDRGAHLSAVLERLSRLSARDVQRIGLSATVGNPEDIARWIGGSSGRQAVVVDPGGARKTPDLAIDHVGTIEAAALVIDRLHPGEKRLVFVDSRRRAEELGHLLTAREVRAFVTHGSLSMSERQDAEQAFSTGQSCVIVATSALELGIDVGDLDRVLQLDAPSTVASFLQRMGRTGRREGASPNCTFLCTKEMELLQAMAIVALSRRGWVEPVAPRTRAAHIYAHQVMALAAASGGVVRQDVDLALRGASAFTDLATDARAAIVDHMLARDILVVLDGRLYFGTEGERRYGKANFRDLYAVFDTPRLIKVEWGGHEIGSVESTFLSAILEAADGGGGCFILAGRSWEVTWVDLERGRCTVKPAESGRPARWTGSSRFLTRTLCEAMRELLISSGDDPAWTERARVVLASLREEHRFLEGAGEAPVLIEAGGEILLWTFAGGAANLLLARMMEAELGERVSANNFRLKLTDAAAQSGVRVREVLRALSAAGRPNSEDLSRFASPVGVRRLSKFEPCLPEPELARLVAERLLDPEGARSTLARGVT